MLKSDKAYKKLVAHYKKMNYHLRQHNGASDPEKKVFHLIRAKRYADISNKYERVVGMQESKENSKFQADLRLVLSGKMKVSDFEKRWGSDPRKLNEMKINDSLRKKAERRADKRANSAYFWNGMKYVARRATGSKQKADDKFIDGYLKAGIEDDKHRTLARNLGKREFKKWQNAGLEKKSVNECVSGDRVIHEKYGLGSVINVRNGYVNVWFDRGYEQMIDEGALGKTLRKITGRGEGLSPKSSAAKQSLADKLEKHAKNHRRNAFNLSYPSSIMKMVTNPMDAALGGSSWREKHADKIYAHSRKQDNHAFRLRDTASLKNSKPKYTYTLRSGPGAEAASVHDFISAHKEAHAKKTKEIKGYHRYTSSKNPREENNEIYWKKHPQGGPDYNKGFTVTPTKSGYHVHQHS